MELDLGSAYDPRGSILNPQIRATAILIEEDHILLVEQRVAESLAREWSLPGGTLETDETLEACLVREVKEETGLDIAVDKLLYVCDRIGDDKHVLHVTFAVHRLGGSLRLGAEPEPTAKPIKSVKMVPTRSLGEYGFSKRFCELVLAGFPESGTYHGRVTNIGL
jgi:ADP-ribose pyrophosphatase YjhB (NUDIX family)